MQILTLGKQGFVRLPHKERYVQPNHEPPGNASADAWREYLAPHADEAIATGARSLLAGSCSCPTP